MIACPEIGTRLEVPAMAFHSSSATVNYLTLIHLVPIPGSKGEHNYEMEPTRRLDSDHHS